MYNIFSMPAGGDTAKSSAKSAPTLLLDRTIRFDTSLSELQEQTSRGERILMRLSPVEDTKGNSGKEGVLYVTNLRFMWHSSHRVRNNLSVGYYGVYNMSVQMVETRLRGHAEALRITARYGSNRFEFFFTHPSEDRRSRLSAVRLVWRAYDTTRIYREVRLRSCAVRDGELLLLKGERLVTRVKGVSNVSSEQGHIGTFFTTNLRLLWCSDTSAEFNISIPFLQIAAMRIQDTEFGLSLMVETTASVDSYVIGFRVDPVARLDQLFKECTSLLNAFKAHPNLGVAVTLQDVTAGNDDEVSAMLGAAEGASVGPQPRELDGENVVQEVATDAFAAYYVGIGQKGADRKPEYNASIGLAVEKLRNGVTLQDLWNVVT